MISKNIMFILLIFYGVLAIASCVDKKPYLALYWIGAIVLNIAVIKMAY